jgi:hypothetical protein
MRIDEVSAVDVPANLTDGWLLLKAREAKGPAHTVRIIGADPEAADHPAPTDTEPKAADPSESAPRPAAELSLIREFKERLSRKHTPSLFANEPPSVFQDAEALGVTVVSNDRQLTSAEIDAQVAAWTEDMQTMINDFVAEAVRNA